MSTGPAAGRRLAGSVASPRARGVAVLLLRAVVTGVFLGFFLVTPIGHPGIEDATTPSGDAWNYLAAGERLDAGHPLYALSAGDRVVDLAPPLWTVPFVGPPLLAVLWRPLAMLPSELVLRGWHLVSVLAALGVVLWLIWKGRPWVVVVLIPLVPALAEGAWGGNANSLLAVASVATWEAWRRERADVAGILTGIAAVAKLTPILVAWWVVVAMGRRGLAWVAAGVAAGVAVSVVGAGVAAHVDWLRLVVLGGAVAPFPWAVGSQLQALGAPPAVVSAAPVAVVIATVVAVAALRRHPALGFAVAVVGCVLASPALSPSWTPLLVTALAPWADRPLRAGSRAPSPQPGAAPA